VTQRRLRTMWRRLPSAVAGVAAAWLLAQAAAAAPDDPKPGRGEPKPAESTAPTPTPPALPEHVETHHTVQLKDRSLDYRAVAETIQLIDEKGAKTASIFTISYLVDQQPGAPRPIAFCFNGGPGAAAVFLHLAAAGPRILKPDPSGRVAESPPQIVDNPSTWLEFTDLVFVDPVGTGFSRGEGKDENPNKPFWNVHGDIQSLDAVVRLWLTKHQRWASPVYIVGESYGGFRVGAMAKSLARDEGIVVSGVVMISPALDMLIVNGDIAAPIAGAVELPSFAATAAALAGNAGFDPAPVERFALSDYLVGLVGIKGVPPPGDPFIDRVAQLTGLPVDIVRRERGWVSNATFAHELRRDQNQVLSLYDGTITRPAFTNPWDPTAGDPILDNSVAALTAAFNAYAPDGLGFHSDLQYRVLPQNIYRQWNFDGVHEGQDGLGLALSGLQTTLLDHPDTKVLIANGRTDLVTPYLSSRWLIDQLAIPPVTREAIRLKVYDGGHMMYLRPQSLSALSADVAALFANP
jgi:carboxypeptidase C (cathepsin A)